MAAQARGEGLSTILVTGGTDGLGRATAILLAEHGYRVFAAGRNPARREALDALARERRLPLTTAEMDVTDGASVDRAVEEIRSQAGPIDALVNSAGIAIISTMEEIALTDLQKQFETNVFGAVRVIQRVLPEMRERRRGRIINMSSVAGKISNPLFGPYSSSKFALEAVSDALRLELYPFGVYVVVIEPGYIPSGMEKASVELSSRYTHNATAGPYAGLYQNFLRFWKRTTGNPRYTSEDCARVILRALRETPPKTRYPVTREARLTILARRWLSDRRLDRMTIRTLGLDRLAASAEPKASAKAAAVSERR